MSGILRIEICKNQAGADYNYLLYISNVFELLNREQLTSDKFQCDMRFVVLIISAFWEMSKIIVVMLTFGEQMGDTRCSHIKESSRVR